MIRVAIANDTVIALEALRRAIASDPTYRLIWAASDGEQAIKKAASDPPDLMLMDLLMPKIDGVEATRQIMARSPCAILIVTASVNRNTSKVFEAMGAGALDVVKTPTLEDRVDRAFGRNLNQTIAARPLLAKMATARAYIGKPRQRSTRQKLDSPQAHWPELVVIGASTGGPKALAEILAQMPADSQVAMVVVQHIDAQFAKGLADWLNEQTSMRVRLAISGDRPVAGTVLVAGGNRHLVMQGDRSLVYKDAASSDIYRPSIDTFFMSLAQCWPLSPFVVGKAVLLTGMGRDGARGLLALRAAKWKTIAESEDSCVVYGMPRAAVDLDAADQVLDIQAISRAIANGR